MCDFQFWLLSHFEITIIVHYLSYSYCFNNGIIPSNVGELGISFFSCLSGFFYVFVDSLWSRQASDVKKWTTAKSVIPLLKLVAQKFKYLQNKVTYILNQKTP